MAQPSRWFAVAPCRAFFAPIALLLAALSFGLAGCATAKFYAKAAIGQATLLLARRDAQAVIDDPATDPAVAKQLRLVAALLRYAEDELVLPAGDRYRSYVDVEGPAVWGGCRGTRVLRLCVAALLPDHRLRGVPGLFLGTRREQEAAR